MFATLNFVVATVPVVWLVGHVVWSVVGLGWLVVWSVVGLALVVN